MRVQLLSKIFCCFHTLSWIIIIYKYRDLKFAFFLKLNSEIWISVIKKSTEFIYIVHAFILKYFFFFNSYNFLANRQNQEMKYFLLNTFYWFSDALLCIMSYSSVKYFRFSKSLHRYNKWNDKGSFKHKLIN